MSDYEVLIGDCRETLRELEPQSVHCVVTSPPFFNLRNYGDDGQIGLEDTPLQYVENMVGVGQEIWRVLRDDGTFWLNLGDSYAGGGGSSGHTKDTMNGTRTTSSYGATATGGRTYEGIKKKDLIGIPWRVAFALQEAGWYLRQSIVWAKPNCMPESVTDRCTRSHEIIFMLTKQPQYYYDHHAIKEPIGASMQRSIEKGPRITQGYKHDSDTRMGKASGNHAFSRRDSLDRIAAGRNKRDVWFISPKPYRDAHFAVYPPDLIEPCILAGTSAKGCCSKCGKGWVRRSLEWEPKCECNGRLVKKEVIIPASMTSEEVSKTTWGTNTDGSYQGDAVKEYEGTMAQNASDVKKRIIEGYSQEKVKVMTVYESDLPLAEHPIEPCVVLDPFGGSGTTAGVAIKYGRKAILCELNAEYAELIPNRIRSIAEIAAVENDAEWL